MTSTEDHHVRPFADWLREHNSGATHDELGETLHTLVGRVNDTGRKGTITLTISVEPMKKAAEGMVLVTDKITTKMPEHDRPGAYFYTDRAGNLVRNDPNQMTFESLAEVPPPPGINLSTGEVTDPTALANHDRKTGS